MPFTAQQITDGGKIALDYFLKNDPIDNVNTAHPLLAKLLEKKKAYGGALQYVQVQVRKTNDSNFQAYFGDDQVTYNNKRTLDQAKYTWGAFHDGFTLNEDQLAQNSIIVTDDRNSNASDAEMKQLTNLFTENTATLKLGMQDNLDQMLHLDGTQNTKNIPGLDLLISTTPSVGTIGGIDASLAANAYWRNFASTAIASTTGVLTKQMEIAYRNCLKFGGKAPDFFFAGSAFIDAYRVECEATMTRMITTPQKGGVGLDASSSGLYFKNVEIIWDPVTDLLDTLYAPSIPWAKRMYMVNTDHLTLRPIEGHWMISRNPPRVYDRYAYYWALTAKAALTTGKRNAHAVLSVA